MVLSRLHHNGCKQVGPHNPWTTFRGSAQVHEQRVINLAYVDAHGNHTERAVEPVGFLGGETGWALIGWCQLRDAGRLFLLDRIQSANLTTTPSPPRNVDEVLGHIPFEVAVA